MAKNLRAEWTSDCGGKQDFDGDILQLSTRYWPRGGGFFVIKNDEAGVTFEGNETRPEIKPSAKAEIILCRLGEDETLMEFKCEAETEAEVKAAIEAWAEDAYRRIRAVLRKAFPEVAS